MLIVMFALHAVYLFAYTVTMLQIALFVTKIQGLPCLMGHVSSIVLLENTEIMIILCVLIVFRDVRPVVMLLTVLLALADISCSKDNAFLCALLDPMDIMEYVILVQVAVSCV